MNTAPCCVSFSFGVRATKQRHSSVGLPSDAHDISASQLRDFNYSLKVGPVSKRGMFERLVQHVRDNFNLNPDWLKRVNVDKAESLLAKVPRALELVYCLEVFRSKLTSLEGAALDEFVQGLLNVASNKNMVGSDMAEAMDIKLEKLNRVINASGEASPSGGTVEWGSYPPQHSAPARALASSPAPPRSYPEVDNSLEGDGTSLPTLTRPVSPGASTSAVLGDGRSETDIRYMSLQEERTFVALFRVVHAPPRKIKRVVNL